MNNFDYLMQLNLLAGRRRGNASFHPILPWVIDMSVAPEHSMNSPAKVNRKSLYLYSLPLWMHVGWWTLCETYGVPAYERLCKIGCRQEGEEVPGWRDLTKTKWRLSKGDEQLNFTYKSSDTPHHISDEALSELAYCIYKVPEASVSA